jgi:hypothetical protein
MQLAEQLIVKKAALTERADRAAVIAALRPR